MNTTTKNNSDYVLKYFTNKTIRKVFRIFQEYILILSLDEKL